MLAIPSNLSPEMAQSVLNAYANELAQKDATERAKRDILECDAAFSEYEEGERPYLGPLVRANTYKKVKNSQLIPGWWSMSGDPRCPVRMRGALRHMIALHSNSHHQASNGYSDAVIKRFIRISKATLVWPRDVHNFHNAVSVRVVRKHRPQNYRYDYFSDGLVLIGGKFVHMNKGQLEYIRKLYGIIENTEKLDKLSG